MELGSGFLHQWHQVSHLETDQILQLGGLLQLQQTKFLTIEI